MPREFTPAAKARRSLQTTYVKRIWNPFVAAAKQYRLIEAGDRIAVCVSGGKDSFLLAMLMAMLHEHSDVPFELVLLSMNPGYNDENARRVHDNAALLGLDVVFFDADIFDTVAKMDGSPCYVCARMRRGHLYKEAQARGCNKIALGHHFNDVIETTLMSMLYGAQIQSMPPKLKSRNYEGMQLIRPLYHVREDDIIAWKNHNQLQFIQCACRFTEHCTACTPDDGGSKRQEMKRLIRELRKTHPDVEKCIFQSTRNVRLDTMIAYTHHGQEHSFLEDFSPPE
ncbi:MAG: tRNA 2-thiocytidine biosynthesis protein TtcA [Oscillospiraceae bacterium]|jgi:tRNA(Ile)-lysidine synthase TilS/MesJ|nr:tRNA 2-thiocytidine biosynthesis protein TtcA [Oscillospiraceae bacterium]